MDQTRQNKVSRLLQKTLGEIFLQESKTIYHHAMITVTNVRVTADLSVARIYLSLYFTNDKKALFDQIEKNNKDIRSKLAMRIKNQLRIVPHLEFYVDDSLDYIENIDRLLN